MPVAAPTPRSRVSPAASPGQTPAPRHDQRRRSLPVAQHQRRDVSEGNAGLTNAVFTVTLSVPSGRQVAVAYTTGDGSAVAGADYQATSGTLGFSPGTTQMSILVPIFGDGAFEPNETFQVTLSAPSLATLGDAYGIGTVVNDDALRLTWGDFYAPRDGSADGRSSTLPQGSASPIARPTVRRPAYGRSPRRAGRPATPASAGAVTRAMCRCRRTSMATGKPTARSTGARRAGGTS